MTVEKIEPQIKNYSDCIAELKREFEAKLKIMEEYHLKRVETVAAAKERIGK